MNRLCQWIYAYKVCRKYSITWNPFRSCKSGAEYQVTVWKCLDKKTKTIVINPFYNGFLSSFMHEVGHLFSWDKGYSRKQRVMNDKSEFEWIDVEREYSSILVEEAKAWRFSRKVLKSKFDKKHAMKCFNTYTASSYKKTDNIVENTDVVYKCIRSIEK